MTFTKLKDGIYSVGVLNPQLRVFDIVMDTEFGTSYNAYLVKGSEKTALIETVHKDYLDELLNNLKGIDSDIKIDYIVMNHNEPDHSGAIEKLIELMPEITVVCSTAGSKYIPNITNSKTVKVQAVKDGEEIDLGGKTLKFINAPFLHWPDSMFTYVQEDKTLFTCDFLGAHYCEPQALDSCVRKFADYEKSFKKYYDAIFSPFKPFVLKGIAKIEGLDFDTVCTSHGPVLTKGNLFEYALEKYTEWSTPNTDTTKSVPVFYCSAYGNTEMLAKQIASGIKSVLADANVETYNIIEHDMGELGGILNASTAFAIGSPTLNRDSVAPVNILLAHIDAVNIAKRPVAVFGSYGWSGEAANNIKARLDALKASVHEEFFKVVFVPSEEELQKAFEFGVSFASTIK